MKPLSKIFKIDDSSLSQRMIALKYKASNILRDDNINQRNIKDITIDKIEGNNYYRMPFKEKHFEFIMQLRK